MREVTAAVPPRISDLTTPSFAALTESFEAAAREIGALEEKGGPALRPLRGMLLRTESVASSKIEYVEARIDDYARALHGSRANASATSMVAATSALDRLLDGVTPSRSITLESVLEAHKALMADDPREAAYAGRVRDMQNWIGGSDHSPRGALYVPPPPDLVEGLLADLFAFCARTDLPTFAQAAVAHAQFESIHPFTDGNGRIGRALIQAVHRYRGVTEHVVIPAASALVTRREAYFDLLGRYRDGDPEPIVRALTVSTQLAAAEARVTAGRLAELPGVWRQTLGRVRRGSATDLLLAALPENPVISADDVARHTGAVPSGVYATVDRLVTVGILRPLTDRRRDQIWAASDLLAEIEDLGVRIGSRSLAADWS